MKSKKKLIIPFIISIVILILLLILLGIVIKRFEDKLNYHSKIQSILADDLEIEKKWLVDKEKIPYNLANAEKVKIEQTYICFSPEIRVRKLNDGKGYSFAVKTDMSPDGMIRKELEKNITQAEYESLINKKEGSTIHKTRYQFLENDNLYAIDIFEDELEGLAYLEIEFENKEEVEKFIEPDWVIKDVTDDIYYKNGYLARYGIPSSFYEYMSK